ncbi:MAG: hypothetical protein OHK0022_14990 [Roseiflexaceae bacterium]
MIPNIFHFVCIGDKPFSLIDYLAVKSAAVVNRPEQIFCYYERPPSGIWWEKALRYLEPVPVVPPAAIGGQPLLHPAHKADVIRLQKLIEHGGVYLDLDVICVRPFAPLYQHAFVLGRQGEQWIAGLGNAVILSEPEAHFARKWLEGFDPATSHWHGFRSRGRDEHWDELSVRYPLFLAERYPEHIHILGHKHFYWPSYHRSHLVLLFEQRWDTFDESFCHHLWATHSWDDYLQHISPEFILNADCNFSRIARTFLLDEELEPYSPHGCRCSTCWQF